MRCSFLAQEKWSSCVTTRRASRFRAGGYWSLKKLARKTDRWADVGQEKKGWERRGEWLGHRSRHELFWRCLHACLHQEGAERFCYLLISSCPRIRNESNPTWPPSTQIHTHLSHRTRLTKPGPPPAASTTTKLCTIKMVGPVHKEFPRVGNERYVKKHKIHDLWSKFQ